MSNSAQKHKGNLFMIRIRPSQEVLATSSGTRRRTFTVGGHTHTLDFGQKPIYLDLDVIPTEIVQDPHLLARQVTQEEMRATGGTLTVLASPSSAPLAAAGLAPEPIDPAPDPDLKSERVQEEAVAPEPIDPEPDPDLKSERVQEEAPAPLSAANSAAKRKR
jgi:hypothetical protein